MTKSLFIDPKSLRQKSKLRLHEIPVCAYEKTAADERGNFTKEEFLRIYRDMAIIREFESMLNVIKIQGKYEGIAYNHAGPAHLSIGQEAAAVGEAFLLDENDFIFGSHRSHGEIIAKGLSVLAKMDERKLDGIMKDYFGGTILKTVETFKRANLRETAIDFLLYGLLAEIFGREKGFNKGMGGSMHAFFPPFGIYPNNAIVGGSGDISVGGALYKKLNRKPGIVIGNIGDASAGCGPVWEGLCFAAMDQYKTLWPEPYRGGLPLIMCFMNNHYGMGGQTCGETMGYQVLARLGAALNPEQMHTERVDGYRPLAVIDAIRRKRKVLEKGDGPVLLDVLTYRYSGHSPSDASSYRTREEVEAWQAQDSIVQFGDELMDAKVAASDELKGIQAGVKERMIAICRMSVDETISPRIDLRRQRDAIGDMMLSNGAIEKLDDRKPESLIPMGENPRVVQIKGKHRFGLDENGKPHSAMKTFNLSDGLFEAILHRFYTDPTLVAYGEENRDWGGAFGVYRGLTEAMPYPRLFNSPISEGAIVGTAVGYGMCGGRVIAEIMYCDFLGRCGDELFNQLPKWQAMSAGILKMPVVVRVSVGSKYGAQHSQDWTSLCAHIPGLKVVFPATPYDAKGLMNAALNGTDPVVFFESQRIYNIGEHFHAGGVPEGYYEVPIGLPDVKRAGTDLTILSIGATLYRAIEAANTLQKKWNVSAEVIDARSIAPFDFSPVVESVKKTGRILLTSDACERGSHLKDFAQTVSELAFDYLDAPPVVVGARNWIVPPFEMENDFFPQADWLIDAIHQKLLPLAGHKPFFDYSAAEQMRLSREGV